MSLITPEKDRVENPIKTNITLKASKGDFVAYDKEEKTTTVLPENLEFIVLEVLFGAEGVTGTGTGKDKKYTSYYSNMVKNTAKQELVITCRDSSGGKGEYARGKWSDIKGTMEKKASYTIYLLAKVKGIDGVTKLTLSSGARGAWFDGKRKSKDAPAIINEEEGSIKVKELTFIEDGAFSRHVPVFETIKFNDKEYTAAKELIEPLIEYLATDMTEQVTETEEDSSPELDKAVSDTFEIVDGKPVLTSDQPF